MALDGDEVDVDALKKHVVVVVVAVEVVVVVGGEVAAMACGRWLWKALAAGPMLPRAFYSQALQVLTGPEKQTTADQVLSFIVHSSASPRSSSGRDSSLSQDCRSKQLPQQDMNPNGYG